MYMNDDGPDGLSPEGIRQARNRGAMIAIGLTAALALFVASFMPKPLIAATLTDLLFFGAIGAAVGGMLRRDPLFAGFLTGWDQSAVLMVLSVMSGWVVDQNAVSQFIGQAGGAS